MDKSYWDSNAIFVFFCHSRFPHKTVCHPFHNFLTVLPPPTLYKVETQRKILDSCIQHYLWGEGMGWVCTSIIGKLPEMQKCPKPFVHDCHVILARKCDSRCHSATSFSENVVVVKTTYQILVVLLFCNHKRPQPPSINITELSLLVNQKYKEAFQSDCLFLEK